MANKIISIARPTDSSLSVEAALVKNADGSAISSPTYADCVANGDGTYTCTTTAPAGTYGPGSQLMRLKGSSPAVTAASLGTITVTGAAGGSGGGTAALTSNDSTNSHSFTLPAGASATDYGFEVIS